MPGRAHSPAVSRSAVPVHDALRVLVVAAGVALIALAVLIPVGLVAALLMLAIGVWLRQRRREQRTRRRLT